MGAMLGATGTNNRLMANVIMLTAISRKIVPISRRMMNMTTVCAGAQPGIAPAGRRHLPAFSARCGSDLAGQPVRPMTA
jgi:hypothetical protein